MTLFLCGFLTFPCLWEISFFSQMILNCQLVIGLRQDLQVIILSFQQCNVGVGGSWGVGISVVDPFEFCSIYFLRLKMAKQHFYGHNKITKFFSINKTGEQKPL